MKTPSWELLCALLLIACGDGAQGQEATTTPVSSFINTTDYDPGGMLDNGAENFTVAIVQCPDKCKCDGGFRRVDCSNASLIQVPEAIPPHVQYLNLNNNALTSLPAGALSNLPDLRVLDLGGNQISFIHEESLVQLAQLQELNLHTNLLNDDDDVAGRLLNSLPGLRVLNVSHNRITDLDINEMTVLKASSIRILDAGYNQLTRLPDLIQLPELRSLHLSHNQIASLTKSEPSRNHTEGNNATITKSTIVSNISTSVFPSITELDLSANIIKEIDSAFFVAFPNLQELDLSDNQIAELSHVWGNENNPANEYLKHLNLSQNAIEHLPNAMFLGCCPNLTVLDVSNQPQLTHINSRSFEGLPMLQSLTLAHSSNLSYIHASALFQLPDLHSLDLSYTAISSMHSSFLHASLSDLNLQGVSLYCSCETIWLQDFNTSGLSLKPENLTCLSESEELVSVADFPDMNCTAANILTEPVSRSLKYEIGASAMFDCVVEGKPAPHVTWIMSKSKHEFTYHPAFLDHSELTDPGSAAFHQYHYWHSFTKYFHNIPLRDRVFVLKNGSLYIDYVTRMDAGQYQCLAENEHGNSSLVMTVLLDYDAVLETQVWCIIVGLGSAISFCLVGMLAGLIRWLAHFCSRKEKEKRRSIWELLVTIQEYKTEKVDVFKAYKDAKLDKISAFKNHKIDKLRTYKQDTVTNILTHMHSMREHYQGQMGKIKDNYSDQVNRLRDNYSQHITKINDYRTEKVERIRDNYQCQALKIRDYGAAQMQRLREQYKLQQQHMLKLLELLDIGNCMSVIEAECMRTESMLFDPNITFDLDATNPVHVPLPRVTAASDDSEYITACSVSDDNTSATVSVSTRKSPQSKATRRCSSSSDNSSTDSSLNLDHSILTANLDPEIQEILLENTHPPHRPPRRQRKKRRKHHSAQCHLCKAHQQTAASSSSPSAATQQAKIVEQAEGGDVEERDEHKTQEDSSCVLTMDSTVNSTAKQQHTAESIV